MSSDYPNRLDAYVHITEDSSSKTLSEFSDSIGPDPAIPKYSMKYKNIMDGLGTVEFQIYDKNWIEFEQKLIDNNGRIFFRFGYVFTNEDSELSSGLIPAWITGYTANNYLNFSSFSCSGLAIPGSKEYSSTSDLVETRKNLQKGLEAIKQGASFNIETTDTGIKDQLTRINTQKLDTLSEEYDKIVSDSEYLSTLRQKGVTKWLQEAYATLGFLTEYNGKSTIQELVNNQSIDFKLLRPNTSVEERYDTVQGIINSGEGLLQFILDRVKKQVVAKVPSGKDAACVFCPKIIDKKLYAFFGTKDYLASEEFRVSKKAKVYTVYQFPVLEYNPSYNVAFISIASGKQWASKKLNPVKGTLETIEVVDYTSYNNKSFSMVPPSSNPKKESDIISTQKSLTELGPISAELKIVGDASIQLFDVITVLLPITTGKKAYKDYHWTSGTFLVLGVQHEVTNSKFETVMSLMAYMEPTPYSEEGNSGNGSLPTFDVTAENLVSLDAPTKINIKTEEPKSAAAEESRNNTLNFLDYPQQ